MDDDEDMDPTPVHEHTIAEPAKWSITVTAVCEHCAEQITQTITDAWEHDDSGDIYCEGIWEDGGA